jgi:hypothetical protein
MLAGADLLIPTLKVRKRTFLAREFVFASQARDNHWRLTRTDKHLSQIELAPWIAR